MVKRTEGDTEEPDDLDSPWDDVGVDAEVEVGMGIVKVASLQLIFSTLATLATPKRQQHTYRPHNFHWGI
jgi:hypothetical protein